MKHSYIILDDDHDSILKTRAAVAGFQNLHFVASASNYDDGINLILEHNPTIVFLEINPTDTTSNLSLRLIDELHRYLKVIPKIIVTTSSTSQAFEAIKYEVLDYLIKPIAKNEVRKTILKFEKTIIDSPQIFSSSAVRTESEFPIVQTENIENPVVEAVINNLDNEEEKALIERVDQNSEIENKPDESLSIVTQESPSIPNFEQFRKENKPLIICVKSYGDYRFIEAKDICYLQADNNSTDIHLYNGEMITAFKTLKHFEGVLSSPFVRIHNSYIVNIDYVSRIHTGNAVCYIKNTTTKLPFSKSYKENVDSIINSITNGNYLEI
ncbi:LytR/AlgR family response regulator transcription factor [Flavobacterium luteum]|uniref:DNA-binding response regulator n=1 Tax=Flavobacterium luteum TaxID=2026654 RepID=A0A7J5AET2_9FLAO|nr:response regulator transcription factor [Flavobacterium luteum]KAB1156070.1 DNA-binding response regulator [Flavobacterium luteum]